MAADHVPLATISYAMERLTGGELGILAEKARLDRPEAVAERERSRTEYTGLKGSAAIALAERKFRIEHPSWRQPIGRNGARFLRYMGSNAAVEALPSGQHVLVESTTPLRSSVGSGKSAPVSLALNERNGSYEPKNPAAPVSIAKRAASGASLPYGVNVAPVQAAEPEASRIVGDRVVYPGTARDTDFMIEPAASGEGIDASWQLLSAASPQENALRFRLPEGATLRASSKMPGGAEIVAAGHMLAIVPPAEAVEADGVTLPVSYTINKNILTTHVDLNGNVSFPVMIDPIVLGSYGQYGAGSWNGWHYYSNCGCINSEEQSGLLWIWTEPGPANGDYGEWYIWAPGAENAGGAQITRVWIDEMTHSPSYQSSDDAEIGESNGSEPIWTDNGHVEAEHPSPMTRDDTYTEDLEFCAQWAGGYWEDPNGQPLCNEEYGGKFFDFLEVMGPEARTVDNYTGIYGAIVWYLDKTPPNQVAMKGLPTGWVTTGPNFAWIEAHDEGTGISAFSVEVPPGHRNSEGNPFFAQSIPCTSNDGFHGCAQAAASEYVHFTELPSGVYSLGVRAYDATGNYREVTPAPKLYIDHSKPEIEPFTGSLAEENGKIGAGDYTLNFDATAGSEAKPGDGVKTIAVAVDGKKVDEVETSCPEPAAIPASNCFGLRGSWTMEGEHYGAGTHTVTVTATDWLGNTASESLQVTAVEAPYKAFGPGVVNLKTGNYKLSAADVNVRSPGADLAFSRTYESRNLTAGADGPLGSQWALSLPDNAAASVFQKLQAEPDGDVRATLADGIRVSYVPTTGGGYEAPAGYQTEILSKPAENEYRMTNAGGDATIFSHNSGEPAGLYVPTGAVQATGAGGLNRVTYIFTRTAAGVTEPIKVIAPQPSGVDCEGEIVKGCRVLTFNYAESTTATGEGPAEWGDYSGRLTRVYLHAWNPQEGEGGEMTTTVVAQYAYDSQGRLRAEWNPTLAHEPEACIASPLSTGCLASIYGYDAEGHVTAVTNAGEETWTITYGADAAEASTGRALKAFQAPVATPLWNGQPVANSEAPQLSGSPVVGTRMAVTNGNWTGGPVSYGFRWEQCDAAGAKCTPIDGADNANYTPTYSDYGKSLVAEVTATNGRGSVVATSAPSAVVTNKYESFSEHALAAPFACANKAAPGHEGDMWWTDSCDHQVGKITPGGAITAYAFPSGICLGGITAGLEKDMWTVEECTNRVAKITSSGAITEYALPNESHPCEITEGSNGAMWFTEFGTSKIGEITASGTVTEYALPSGSEPYGITAGTGGNLWFTEYGTSKIGKIAVGGTVTEYSLPSGSYPYGLTMGSAGDLWITDEWSNKITRMTTAGVVAAEYSLPAGSRPTSIASTPEGDVRFTETGASAVGKMAANGAIQEYELPANSEPIGIAVAADHNHIYVANRASNTLADFSSRQINEYNLPNGSEPFGVAAGPDGNLWFTDFGTSHVGKSTTAGAITEYPADNAGPEGITNGPNGSLWFVEHQIRRVNHMSTTGALSTYTLTRTDTYNVGIAQGPYEDLWFTEAVAGYIGRMNAENEVVGEYALPSGSEPYGIAQGPGGDLWFTDHGTNKIGKITTSGEVTEYALPTGSKPYWIASGPEGKLWFTDAGTDKIGNITTAGQVSEYALPAGSEPRGITDGTEGDLWFTDYGTSKIGKITTQGEVTEYALPAGAEPTGITVGPEGHIWFTNYGTSKLGEFVGASQPVQGETRAPQPGFTIAYNVPVTGQATSHDMSAAEVARWGQRDVPVDASAIFPPEEPQSWPASAYSNATIYYLDAKEQPVNVANPAGGITTVEYDSHDDVTRTLTADNRRKAMEAGGSSPEVARDLSTEMTYNAEGTELESTLGPEHAIKVPGMSGEVAARAHTVYSYDKNAPAEGGPYYLITETTEAALLADGKEVDPHSTTDSYGGQEGLGWKLREPTTVTTAPSGMDVTRTVLYSATTGAALETQMPAKASSSTVGNQSAHDSQIIHYSAGTESSVPACQNRPEWANLVCETRPKQQPEVEGMPELPVTTVTYNIYDEPLITTSVSGTATRTATDTYDSGGRLVKKETTSTTGGDLPAESYTYNETTGALEKESAVIEGKEEAITSTYNTRGELAAYEDANGGTSTYKYDEYGRLIEANEGPGQELYSYSPTGLLTKLSDSAAGAFEAKYDVEGNLVSESYPDGLIACYGRNANGETTSLAYYKASACGEGAAWLQDGVVPSVQGKWASQESTLSTESYAYNEAGTLTEVQETPIGGGCLVRQYGYDEDGNRTSMTTREAGAEGKCAEEGGMTETHTYDTADRLIDPGVAYNQFGDITRLPATDVGGNELTSSFYADGQVAEQKQAESGLTYQLDPARRVSAIVGSGSQPAIRIEHYSEEGAAPAWLTDASGKWTRYVEGIGVGMVAIQREGESPVLELRNLHGDIVATAEDNETATKLLSTSNSTEYGVPTKQAPARYSWLGSQMLATELPSGVAAMGVRSYVPQLGRFLQPDPQPGGSANAYAYTHGDPLNEVDLSGAWSLSESSGGLSAVTEGEGEGTEGETGIAAGAIMPAPVNAQLEAEAFVDPPWDQITAGGEEYEEFEEAAGYSEAAGAGIGAFAKVIGLGVFHKEVGCAAFCETGHGHKHGGHKHRKHKQHKAKGSKCPPPTEAGIVILCADWPGNPEGGEPPPVDLPPEPSPFGDADWAPPLV